MCDESLEVVPPMSKSEDFGYSKFVNIDDFPESILFEIVVRLPFKSVARYKCVSTRWLAMISHHTFISRYLSLQREKGNPFLMEPTLIYLDCDGFFATSKLPIFETGSYSLNFLPSFQSAHGKKAEFHSPIVVSCNDLILCRPSKRFQCEYYVCNPYTKQYTAIPHPPQCCFQVQVGFICEPYYYECDKDGNSNVHLNVDYKYAIVRILSPIHGQKNTELGVEIFSSATGKWSEFKLSCPPYLLFNAFIDAPGLAYKGKLYWVNQSYPTFMMISLDPFSDDNKKFDVVDLPINEGAPICLSREGRLRLFRTRTYADDIQREKFLNIWELRDEEDDIVDGRGRKWCKIDTLPLSKMVSESPLLTQIVRSCDSFVSEVAFDSSNDDIMYLILIHNANPGYIHTMIACNIRENTLKEVSSTNHKLMGVEGVNYMVPWWPTPVSKINFDHKDDTHLGDDPDASTTDFESCLCNFI